MNKTINYEDGKNMQESDKIWLIFDEFNKYNEDVAEKDLLRAAQDLIDLSKSEYVHKNEIDRKDLLIDRLELFLQRDCFVDCK